MFYKNYLSGVFDASAFRTAAAAPESALLLNTLLDADLTDKDSNNLVLVSDVHALWLGCVCASVCMCIKSLFYAQ